MEPINIQNTSNPANYNSENLLKKANTEIDKTLFLNKL